MSKTTRNRYRLDADDHITTSSPWTRRLLIIGIAINVIATVLVLAFA